MPSPTLVDRVRLALAAHQPREVAMFGGISFMVDDRMVAAARRDGDLLLRIDPEEHAELAARPGAATATMGKDRTMGEGWLAVSDTALPDDDSLADWLSHALDFHAAQTTTG